jgi:sugar transferase (PEP-CTERM/EpsH1 system associated)
MSSPPLIAHVIQRLAVGGMENGLVNLINHMPEQRYGHAIICLSDSTAFRSRIRSSDVQVIELHKPPGHDPGVYLRLWRSLRELKPDVVHTRNLPALEFQFIAALAGIKARIHSEHGRDVHDLDGRSRKYSALRKAMRPFVQHYAAVSRDLEEWLIGTVGIPRRRVTQIYNGVRADLFQPLRGRRNPIGPEDFMSQDSFVIGTVGRLEIVKDQLTLVRAFIHLLKTDSRMRERLRLVIIGAGSLRQPAFELLRAASAEELAWLPGEREDVPEMMRTFDLFVLPSLREGISNTILEAMASGLPVLATRVGGNPELVLENITGTMVAPSDPFEMAEAINAYYRDPDKAAMQGSEGRRRIESCFSMEAMVAGYLNVYDSVLFGRRKTETAADPGIAIHPIH